MRAAAPYMKAIARDQQLRLWREDLLFFEREELLWQQLQGAAAARDQLVLELRRLREAGVRSHFWI